MEVVLFCGLLVSAIVFGSRGLGWSSDKGIALCSWGGHLTLTVPLSSQVYKWVPGNLMLAVPCYGLASHPGGSRNTLNHFMLQKAG